MPLYEYNCPSCGRFEIIQKFSDAPHQVCPRCASAVEKLLSSPAIQFKGSGWYVTDYARKSPNSEGGKEGGPKGGGEAAGTGKADAPAPSESKSSTPSSSTSKDSTARGQ